jgi:hypothetical protein
MHDKPEGIDKSGCASKCTKITDDWLNIFFERQQA